LFFSQRAVVAALSRTPTLIPEIFVHDPDSSEAIPYGCKSLANPSCRLRGRRKPLQFRDAIPILQ
jgi:hypothetical protein